MQVKASYKGTMKKLDSSGAAPKDIDIPYDVLTVGSGWYLYNRSDKSTGASGSAVAQTLTSTAASVTTTANFFPSPTSANPS